MGKLRDPERKIIEHALGLDRVATPYRNAFVAGADHADGPMLDSLVQLGFMRASHTMNDGQDTVFVVTDAGRAALNKDK